MPSKPTAKTQVFLLDFHNAHNPRCIRPPVTVHVPLRKELQTADTKRPTESYARLYDDILDNRKVVAAGPLCFALYCAALVYCHRNDTDGHLQRSRLRSLLDFSGVAVDPGNPAGLPDGPVSAQFEVGVDPLAVAEALVEAGLFDRNLVGYSIHDYTLHNLSHAERNARRNAGSTAARTRWGNTEGNTKEEGRRKKTSPNGEVPRPDVEELCEVMQFLNADRGAKATITKTWRGEARLLLDRDKRPLMEALTVMRWAARDSFWRANILSIPTFRKQYDKLKLGMERPRKNANGNVDERVRNLLDNPLPALVGHD